MLIPLCQEVNPIPADSASNLFVNLKLFQFSNLFVISLSQCAFSFYCLNLQLLEVLFGAIFIISNLQIVHNPFFKKSAFS